MASLGGLSQFFEGNCISWRKGEERTKLSLLLPVFLWVTPTEKQLNGFQNVKSPLDEWMNVFL